MNQQSVDPSTIPSVSESIHPSALRLLQLARKATAGTPHPVAAWGDLLVRLDISPATLSNWKRRGVSRNGALAAESEFGISPNLVLDAAANSDTARRIAEPAPSYRATTSPSVAEVLRDLQRVLASAPPAMLGAAADVMAEFVRSGGTDSDRLDALAHLLTLQSKPPRAANM